MNFCLYLDESGKTGKDDFTSLCGYCATTEELARFAMDWDNVRFKLGVPPIHLSRMVNPQFKNDEWTIKHKYITDRGIEWGKWRSYVLDQFAQLIEHSNMACVGSVVDTRAYRELKDHPQCNVAYDNANVFLLHNAVMRAMDSIEVVDRNGLLTIFIDDDQESSKTYYDSYWNLRTMLSRPNLKIPDWQKPRFERLERCVHAIGFCNDIAHPAVQAADMIAYLARRYKLNLEDLDSPRPEHLLSNDEVEELYARITRIGTMTPQIYRREDLFKVFSGSEKRLANQEDEEEYWRRL